MRGLGQCVRAAETINMSALAASHHGHAAKPQARERAPSGPTARRDVLNVALFGGLASSMLAVTPQQASAATGPAATLESAYGAFGSFVSSGDYSTLDSFFTNDTTWLSNVNGGFQGKGKADVKRFFAWNLAANAVSSFRPLQFVEQGNKVASLVAMAGSGKATGRPYDTVLAHFATVEGGKITEFREVAGSEWSEAMGGVPFPK
eukprot:XP_001695193.1 ketoacid isomerase-like protein [Chlamydomonas reinhardtii]